jgi:hypothetical protein
VAYWAERMVEQKEVGGRGNRLGDHPIGSKLCLGSTQIECWFAGKRREEQHSCIRSSCEARR